MCGLAGCLGWIDGLGLSSRDMLGDMCAAIRHRGPDADGVWLDEASGIALGHLRLSILDLSAAGAQPMVSHGGRYVLAFNGEIYNYQELRADLVRRRGAIDWRGHSDTEVLLELIAAEGVERALRRLDGMFAIALWDRETRTLTLARDAFGEKPLYYGLYRGAVLFASELKALRAVPGFQPDIDPDALADYFKYSYVPGPATIHRGVFKLQPGHMLTLGPERSHLAQLPDPVVWWSPDEAAMRARREGFEGDMAAAVAALRAALSTSVRRRLASDVPLGSLLSGGVDSSVVTALMQQAVDRPVKTFSIGMAETGYDEAAHARAVAARLGTEHQELILSPREVQDVAPQVADIYDEPFSDASQIPTFLLSRMARAHVTVALSGDGGDEILGGYNRYFHGADLWARASRLPTEARRLAGAALGAIPPGVVDRAAAMAGRLAPRELSSGRAGEKIQKLARVLSAADRQAYHDRLLATADDVAIALDLPGRAQTLAARSPRGDLTFVEQAMLTDTANYMPDDVLVKVDRASMAVGLEVRTPFLSREVFDLAWRLPMAFRAHQGVGKRVLRELLYTLAPRDLVDRPKAGFAVPVGRWLRTDLRDWAEAGLSEAALQDAGVFRVPEVRRRWREHLTGRRDHETFLWSVLMYQGWRRSVARGRSDAPGRP
ncbi:asparagine synthase (glutamine-hydrolyzing) [Hansschlegelia plantiphila]|uniref:asparagine synthase (glutamine-hydrolyzing) n=1 Tax=Hansschlegelia plantiphila TaxID=374655 RepID=A0A9W6MXB2_9HYPH|nr:asparagine synthase (glutamine-hydrolyzing) [Hansschlegelia plantiphila]GLK69715.1 asparagine synthetase B [Hansschlegelia plantiphila]